MATGSKTYNGAIGVDPNLKALPNLTEDFEAKGKSTGVITSVELSHATPAAFVVHDPDRSNYSGIANQMIKESRIDVIMGAGNPLYNDDSVKRSTVEADHYQFVGGQETLVIVTSDHETGYLTGSAGIYDEVVNNGQGQMPTMVWNSEGHTNQLVPVFAKGPGADLFQKYAVGADPVRGAYINNTDIPRVIRELLE